MIQNDNQSHKISQLNNYENTKGHEIKDKRCVCVKERNNTDRNKNKDMDRTVETQQSRSLFYLKEKENVEEDSQDNHTQGVDWLCNDL